MYDVYANLTLKKLKEAHAQFHPGNVLTPVKRKGSQK
jgi:hypothetical protein